MLERETDAEGNTIIHPHEALQSIAVELARGNVIALQQLAATRQAVEHLAALVAQAKSSKDDVAAAQTQSMDAVMKILGPVISRFAGRIPTAQQPPAPPALAPAGEVVAPSRTARITASAPTIAEQA